MDGWRVVPRMTGIVYAEQLLQEEAAYTLSLSLASVMVVEKCIGSPGSVVSVQLYRYAT